MIWTSQAHLNTHISHRQAESMNTEKMRYRGGVRVSLVLWAFLEAHHQHDCSKTFNKSMIGLKGVAQS